MKNNSINIKVLKGLYKGGDIYVIASGSSLNYVKKDFFDNKITIGVNLIWRFFNCNYVVKHHNGGQAVIDNGLKLVSSRNDCCTPDMPNSYKGLYYYYNHENKRQVTNDIDYSFLDSEDSLVVGRTTVIDAMSFAYFIGAKNIILCGADGGCINGDVNLKGYYEDTRKTNPQEMHHVRITNILIKEFADVLRKKGIGVYSLNPFVDFQLEGNKFDIMPRHPKRHMKHK
jgi:hypothetical protein